MSPLGAGEVKAPSRRGSVRYRARVALERLKSQLVDIAVQQREVGMWHPESAGLPDLLAHASEEERQTLGRILGIDAARADAKEIAAELRSAGSSSVATKGRWILNQVGIRSGDEHVPYSEIVDDVAETLKAAELGGRSLPDRERAVVVKLVKNLETENPAALAEIVVAARAEAERRGLPIDPAVLAGGAIAVAQLSGFGVYLLATTMVGALTHAVGVALPFLFYMKLAKVLALVIGPPGMAAVGVFSLVQFTGANERKTVPSVVLIAGIRQRLIAEREAQLERLSKRRESLLSRMELAELATNGPTQRFGGALRLFVPVLIPAFILAALGVIFLWK